MSRSTFRCLYVVKACVLTLVWMSSRSLVIGQGTTSTAQPQPAASADQRKAQTNPNQAKNSTFTLDVESSASSGSVTLTRPDNGLVPLNIIYNGPSLKNVPITIAGFLSDGGGMPLDVKLQSSCEAAPGKDPHSIASDAEPNKLIPLCLVLDKLPLNKPYTGRLTIAPSSGPFVIKTITFNRPLIPQGVLVLDQNAQSRTFSRCLWGNSGHTEGIFSARLREKTSGTPLDGVSVRLESGGGGSESGLDLENNLTFLWNGKQTDLERSPPKDATDSRSIGEGHQAVVTVQVHDLKPGDYTAVLRFSAINSSQDDAQKLELHVHIRSAIGWATFWLLASVGVSFIATKVLTTMRCRANLLAQIRALEPQWFSSALPTPLVVGLRAVLHQTKTLSKRFWLTSPDLIAAHLNDAQRMLHVLDEIRQLRDKLELALEKLVYRRVAVGLDRVVERLGESPLTDTDVQNINLELAKFNSWLDSQQFPTVFWNDIQPALRSLQTEMTAAPDPRFQDPFVLSLTEAVSQALTKPPTDQAGLEQLYKQYVRLRVLWEERDGFADLLGPAQGDLSSFLDLADLREWERIKADPLELRVPKPSSVDDLEAYQVLHFSVKVSDPKIESAYIFRHKIEYRWNFELRPSKKNAKPVVLQPVSLGPTVVQYFPVPGKISAKVTLAYAGETKPIQASDPLWISPSSDFQPYKILEGAEILSWIISAITALVTGLSMFYFKNVSWGTYQDYLTLVLWGMGVDQGKTFVQALKANSP
jgi:hypothetical protein